MRPIVYRRLLVALGSLVLAACSSISNYEQAAYEHATAAKVDTLAVMSKATDSYASHQREIAELQITLDKAYEYDRGRPINQTTMQMWDVLLKVDYQHPDEGLWPRFLESWRKNGTLSPVFISDKKEHIAAAFDTIIALESGKNRSSPAKP
jgi:outer membrane murein-binding lipoprotein Lpp